MRNKKNEERKNKKQETRKKDEIDTEIWEEQLFIEIWEGTWKNKIITHNKIIQNKTREYKKNMKNCKNAFKNK